MYYSVHNLKLKLKFIIYKYKILEKIILSSGQTSGFFLFGFYIQQSIEIIVKNSKLITRTL